VRADHASVVTRVTDNGPGIAPEALERIFELFAQEETVRQPNDSGLGIGLSLTRALVSQHGGLVTAQSAGLGHGSTFIIRLPLGLNRRLESTLAPADERAAGPAQKVLVVDDNRDAADSMADMLRLMGDEVQVAYDGRQALGAVAPFAPAWALLDINMPGMNGYSLLRALRAQPGMAALRAVAVTGYGQPADRERTLSAGFDAHLTKPVELAQLHRLIHGAPD
jgi:CheY-like chemotaxis protein